MGSMCYHPAMGDDSSRWLQLTLVSITTIVALGVLGLGIYAVFHSANGPGTAALLVIGPIALFVIAFHDRIRSMEFGGARIQLALQVKDSLRRAFRLRIAGNYEQAQDEIEDAFVQFVAHEPYEVRKAYYEARDYRNKVINKLGDYVKSQFKGRVLGTASSVSFLPLIDAVMAVDGEYLLEVLRAYKKQWCPELTERVRREGMLRTAVIVRPGPELNSVRLVDKLWYEVKGGALGIDCFLLVQDCKDSDSRKEFCDLANRRRMHAKSLVWEPASGSEMLEEAFLGAILTICTPSHCGYSTPVEILPEFGRTTQGSSGVN